MFDILFLVRIPSSIQEQLRDLRNLREMQLLQVICSCIAASVEALQSCVSFSFSLSMTDCLV